MLFITQAINTLRQKFIEPNKLFLTVCHIHVWDQKPFTWESWLLFRANHFYLISDLHQFMEAILLKSFHR